MKTFLAIYVGSDAALARSKWAALDEEQREAEQSKGFDAWMTWGETNAVAIADRGSPIGKTKRVSPDGISDIRNNITGYVVVEVESHEAAARMFENHPHFTIFPGDSVEVMEILPFPSC